MPGRKLLGPLGHSLAALAGAAALPVLGLGLVVSPRLRVGLRERLGARERLPAEPIWIHGASVGEIRSGLGLIRALEEAGFPCIATTTSVTGRDLLRRERPGTPCHLAPLDHPWLVRKVLAEVRPKALVILESDFWPALIEGAQARGVPVFALSARLSEHSAKRLGRTGPIARALLGRLAGIGVRSPEEAQRFASLGVLEERIAVTGDLKRQLPKAAPAPPREIAEALTPLRVWIAGSTHAGEEAAACEAQLRLREEARPPLLLIAPRHPERFDEVEKLIAEAGLEVTRRSSLSGAPLAPGSVLLLDSLGELASLYPLAEFTFLGGSLADRGGHNPMEAACAGIPILVGPHTRNAREAVETLAEAGCLEVVNDRAALVEAILRLAHRGSTGERALPDAWFSEGERVVEESVRWLLEQLS